MPLNDGKDFVASASYDTMWQQSGNVQKAVRALCASDYCSFFLQNRQDERTRSSESAL